MNVTDKILIERLSDGHACALIRDGIVIDLFGDPPQETFINRVNFGSIFSAVPVRDLKGASGSILNLGSNLKGFIKKSKDLKVGESLFVQCVNTTNENKLPLFSKDILIKEKYFIINPSGRGVSLSKKLSGNERLKDLREHLIKYFLSKNSMGIILRSSCVNVSNQEVIEQIRKKIGQYSDIFRDKSKTPRMIFDGQKAKEKASAEWAHVKDENVIETKGCFELHGIWDILEELKRDLVELKDGGSLAIEKTKALISVDINSGKNVGRNATMDANRQAMAELPRQLRLRGLGGVVNIDFAPLRKQERPLMVSILRRQLIEDPVRTDIVGWSPLGNLELNRKNERISVLEWLR